MADGEQLSNVRDGGLRDALSQQWQAHGDGANAILPVPFPVCSACASLHMDFISSAKRAEILQTRLFLEEWSSARQKRSPTGHPCGAERFSPVPPPCSQRLI